MRQVADRLDVRQGTGRAAVEGVEDRATGADRRRRHPARNREVLGPVPGGLGGEVRLVILYAVKVTSATPCAASRRLTVRSAVSEVREPVVLVNDRRPVLLESMLPDRRPGRQSRRRRPTMVRARAPTRPRPCAQRP